MAISFEELLLLPKAELHLHLRGTITPDLIEELVAKHPMQDALQHAPERHRSWFDYYETTRTFISKPSQYKGDAKNLFNFSSLRQFLTTYLLTGYLFKDRTDIANLVRTAYAYLQQEGIVYAEITVSVPEYLDQGISLSDIISGLEDPSVPPGITVNWIVDFVRNFGGSRSQTLLEQLISIDYHRIVGITLGGGEDSCPTEDFIATYARAREAGLKLSVHAGEALGSHSVEEAVNLLGVDRIGHGFRAVEDPHLIERLVKHRIPLEICPTGNVVTEVVSDLASHPVHTLIRHGVLVTINTDDPTFFGTGLCLEFSKLANMGYSRESLIQLIRNGFEFAFSDTNLKQKFLGLEALSLPGTH